MDIALDRPRRTLARDERRLQVIEATIATIAARGLARLTLGDVAREAGVSHGLVLFHFASKDNLLAETLEFLSDEYQKNRQAAVDGAGPKPAARLLALVLADFQPAISTLSRTAAWCAFWAEAPSRPSYQRLCGERDASYIRQIESVCSDLVTEAGYGVDPIHAARILRLVIEGIWLDMVTIETPYSLADARGTVAAALALCFPRHFSATDIARLDRD